MSNGAQTPQRKGLHPLAWVGIGCAVLIVIVVVSLGALSWWGYSKAKEAGLDPASIRDNPALAAARLALAGNPDLEVLDADTETGKITIRNTKTGELIEVNFEDIEEGRLSWTTDGEETRVDFAETADGGTVRIESDDGKAWQLSAGSVSEEIPDWVPVYAGGDPVNRSSVTTDEGTTGSFQVSTGDPVADVVAFYRDRLKAADFEISVNTFPGEGTEGAMVNGQDETGKRSVMVMINREDGKTRISVNFSSGS